MSRILRPNDMDLQLFAGSGAGLNRVNKVVLRCAAASSATYDSGPVLWEAAYFSKTGAQLICLTGTTSISGWSVACYGTYDERALLEEQSPPPDIQYNPNNPPTGFTFPTTSWVQWALPQTETAPTWKNPIVALGQSAFSPEPFVAVRFVATASSATGDIAIVCVRIP
jgi:hypothetical protein